MNWLLITTTFLAVNLDFFVILLFLCQKYPLQKVIIGYLLGLFILMSAAFFIGQLLSQWLPEWLLGFLGVIPIWTALHDQDETMADLHGHSPIMTILITYLGVCAGCNLSLFLPVLANQSLTTFALTLTYIALLTIIIVHLIALFGHFKPVQAIIKHWGDPLMKVCYIGIGIYVFFDSGLVHHLIS